jgi:hypothetical protein
MKKGDAFVVPAESKAAFLEGAGKVHVSAIVTHTGVHT